MSGLFTPLSGLPNLTQIFSALQEIYQGINGLQQTISKIFPGGLTSSTSWVAPTITSGAQSTKTVTCAGAVLGQAAEASFNADLQGLVVTAYVSAADTVTVVAYNGTGGSVSIGTALLKVFVHS